MHYVSSSAKFHLLHMKNSTIIVSVISPVTTENMANKYNNQPLGSHIVLPQIDTLVMSAKGYKGRQR